MYDLQKVIEESFFTIIKGSYCVAKFNGTIDIAQCFMVTSDDIEQTAIFPQNVTPSNIIEKKDNYTLIAIDVSIPFYAVGFLATITSNLAKKNISVLVVSTFSRDYILVANDYAEESCKTLLEMGMSEKTQ